MADGDQKSIGNALDSSARSDLVADDVTELQPRQQRSSFNPEDIELLIRKLKNPESHQQDPESDNEGLETSGEANSTYLTHGNPLDDGNSQQAQTFGWGSPPSELATDITIREPESRPERCSTASRNVKDLATELGELTLRALGWEDSLSSSTPEAVDDVRTKTPSPSLETPSGSGLSISRKPGGKQWVDRPTHDHIPFLFSHLTETAATPPVERTTESPIPPTKPLASPSSTDASNSNDNINAENHPTEANPTSPDTPINNDINPENRPTSSNISTSNPDEPNANSPPGPSTLPTKAYPISPACPWLGAPPSQLDLLAALPDGADRVDAVLRAHAVDPRAVAAPDRALLLALLHAADTAGRETLGFAPGRDARRGALRFVDLRDPGRGVDVRVWEFLGWLRGAVGGAAGDAGGCVAVREGSGEGSEEGSEGSRERRMRLLVETPEGSVGEGGGGGGKGARWCLLLRLLRENGLDILDVSREHFDEWADRPLGDDVGYFETHMRDALRLKNMERMEIEEDVDMVGLSEEEWVKSARERSHKKLTGSAGGEGERNGGFAPAHDEENLTRLRMGQEALYAHTNDKGEQNEGTNTALVGASGSGEGPKKTEMTNLGRQKENTGGKFSKSRILKCLACTACIFLVVLFSVIFGRYRLAS